jgi:RluA family pseudouridine synthase
MVESTLLGKRTHQEAFKDDKPPEDALPKEKSKHIYDIKNGVRFVIPYEFEFTTFTKRRWIG